jgi:NADPH-dependent curcumin reductase CurA
VINRRWLIAERPLGRELRESDFREAEAAMPSPGPGQVLVRVNLLSIDPALKSYMENIAGYAEPTEIGGLMPGEGLGRVVASQQPGFAPGDRVRGAFGWQEYAVVDADALRVPPPDASDTAALGVLGVTGKAAYCGLVEVGRPKPGDVLVVSGAGGATGSVAGQIGKIAGCTVIGIAGGPEKCRRLVEGFGFDAVIDYKSEKLRSRLRELAPQGVDIVFDNVGGDVLNDCLARLRHGARVVICGGISRYNFDPRDRAQMPEGPRNYFNLVHAHASMQGFVLHDFERYYGLAEERLSRWLGEQRIKEACEVFEGFERAPLALIGLFAGGNFGKQLVRLGGGPVAGALYSN